MANDISIIVSAELGDTLIKLDLAKKAVQDLGDANARTATTSAANTRETSRLAGALGFLTGNWRILVPAMTAAGVALLGFTGNMGALLPLVPVLTALLAGLLAPFTTLAAVVVALIAPISLLVGLLGVLGAGFLFAAKQAFGKGGSLAGALADLQKQFHELVAVLVQDFMPVFKFLISSASEALTYLTKLAHLPLKKAFDSLSTTGVEGLTHFLDKIGSFLAKPIRLAFDIAFGPQGGQIRNSLLKIWTQIQAFFEKPPSTGGPSISQEVGAWFGRQDFTAVGMRWASELAGAMVGALGAALKKAMSTQGGRFIGGGALAGAGIGAALGGPIGAALGAAIGVAAGVVLNHYWPRIRQAGIDAFHAVGAAVKRALGPQLWNNIISLARSFWDWMKGVGRVIASDIWPAVKKVWDALGGWHTVITIIVAAIRIIVTVFVSIYNAIRTGHDDAKKLAQVIGGAVLTGVNAVSSAISAIVSGIQTAISLAQTLAGALSSANPNQAVQNAGGSSGGRYGINQGGIGGHPSRGYIANFHYHAAPGMSSIAERAAFDRFAQAVGQAQARQQVLLAGGH